MQSSEAPAEIRVQFVTQQKRYVVPTQPIALPASLRRSQLSQTINHLLQLTTPVAFDFLVGGTFLRTSLGRYLDDTGLSTEELVVVEYVVATPPPPPPQDTPQPDWVASVAARADGLVVAGGYDGVARVLNGPAPSVALAGHTGAVKGVAWLVDAVYGAPACVTASQDETLRVWVLPAHGSAFCHAVLQGHTAALTSVAVQPTSKMLASGCVDATIRLWSPSDADDNQGLSQPAKPAKPAKRRKLEAPVAVVKRSLAALTGSGASVRALAWHQRETLLSAGDDHCVRLWDIEAGVNTVTRAGSQVINEANLVAAAEFDGRVRFYDLRSDGAVVKVVLSSHKAPASTVAWSPSLPQFQIASGSFDAADNNVKLWDIRSRAIPLHNLTGHDGQVLCSAWASAEVLHTGGADCAVKHHRFDAAVGSAL